MDFGNERLGEVRGSYKDGLAKTMELLEGVSVPGFSSGTLRVAQGKRAGIEKYRVARNRVLAVKAARESLLHAPSD